MEIRPLSSALHLAQGDMIAVNGLTGTFIYSVTTTINCMPIILTRKRKSRSRHGSSGRRNDFLYF